MRFAFIRRLLVRFVLVSNRRGSRLIRNAGCDGIEEIADAQTVLGADGVDFPNSKLSKVLCGQSNCVTFNFVDGEKDGLRASGEETREIVVGTGKLCSGVHDQDDCLSFFEGDFSLVINLGGNEFRIVGDDSACIHEAEASAIPLEFSVDAITGDSWFVAHNGTTAARQAVE